MKQKTAVLDSSVLVSAFITPRGTVGEVLRAAARGAFRLCLSLEILEETAGALQRPKLVERYRRSPDAVREFVSGLAESAHLVRDLPRIRAVPLDPKDNIIVATAVKAKAAYLVTGDRKHLLALGTYEGIAIVTPRQFLDLINESDR